MSTINQQPSIAWEVVEGALVEWVRGITGLEAIWAEDGGPQPDRPYVDLDWLQPPSKVGDDYFEDVVDEETEELARYLEGVREGIVTVQVHTSSKLAGENAMYFADLLATSLQSDGVRAKFFEPARMTPIDWQPLRKGSFVEDKKSVSRAAFDVRFSMSAGNGQASERVGYIKSVAVTGVVSTPEETLSQALSITGG
jgi:hypothetical protein